jgi:hypothetical protein
MKRLSRLLVLFLVLIASSGFAACSKKSGVPPEQYATDICTAARQWVETIQQGAQDFGGGLTASSSPDQIKEGLVGFLEDAIDQTEQLIGDVEDAGVPAVDGGEQASEDLTSAFEDVQAAFEDARDRAEALPTDDRTAFAQGAQELGTTVQESLLEIGTQLEDQGNEELKAELDQNEACTELQNVAG